MTLNKNKTRKAVVAIYATELDVKHPTILRLAYNANIVTKEQFQQILKVENQLEISPEQLSLILENYFGFESGGYEEHLIEGSQVNKIGGDRVDNVKRYTGWERLDKEWVDTGLASREAYELCKYGEVLAL